MGAEQGYMYYYSGLEHINTHLHLNVYHYINILPLVHHTMKERKDPMNVSQ